MNSNIHYVHSAVLQCQTGDYNCIILTVPQKTKGTRDVNGDTMRYPASLAGVSLHKVALPPADPAGRIQCPSPPELSVTPFLRGLAPHVIVSWLQQSHTRSSHPMSCHHSLAAEQPAESNHSRGLRCTLRRRRIPGGWAPVVLCSCLGVACG